MRSLGPQQEECPSQSRPYKQYCTTLLVLVKAEAILIGSCLQGDVDEMHLYPEMKTFILGLNRRKRKKDINSKHKECGTSVCKDQDLLLPHWFLSYPVPINYPAISWIVERQNWEWCLSQFTMQRPGLTSQSQCRSEYFMQSHSATHQHYS